MNNRSVRSYSTVRSTGGIKGIGRRIFAVLMSVILVVGLMPSLGSQYAYAADEDATVTVTLNGNDGYFLVEDESQISRWDGETTTAADQIEQDSEGTYLLNSAADLAGFAVGINSGEIGLSADATLTINCDMSKGTWTPIAHNGNGISYSYTGTFDGAEHTVTFDETLNVTSALYWGFFDQFGGTVKGLTVNGSLDITSTSGAVCAGGIAAYARNDGMFINCVNKMTINASGTNTVNVGGIVGYDWSTTILNCGNEADITGTTSSGENNNYVGGIDGCVDPATTSGDQGGPNSTGFTHIENSYNWGNVTASFALKSYAGGISGYVNYPASGPNCFYNCYSAANEVVAGTVGGLFGNLTVYTNNRDANIEYCYWPASSGLEMYGKLTRGTAAGSNEVEPNLTGSTTYSKVSTLLDDLNDSSKGFESLSDYTYTHWVADAENDDLPWFGDTSANTTKEVPSITLETNADGMLNMESNYGYQIPVRPDDFEFVGWAYDPTGKQMIKDITTETFDKDTIIYAIWQAIPQSYIVNFNGDELVVNANDEAVAPHDEVVEGSTIAVFPVSDCEGVTFAYITYRDCDDPDADEVQVDAVDGMCTFDMPSYNIEITGYWTANEYNVTVKQTTGGTVTVTRADTGASTTKDTTVPYQTGVYVDVEVDADYELSGVKVTRSDTGDEVDHSTPSGHDYAFDMPASDVTVEATFAAIPYDIAVEPVDNGEVSVTIDGTEVTTPTTATVGQEIVVTVTPDFDYEIENVTIKDADGNVIASGTDATYTFDMPTSGVTVEATMSAIEHHIEVEADDHGFVTIDHEEATTGEPISFRVTANAGYEVADVVITDMDGNDISASVGLVDNGDGTYTFTMPSIDVDVQVTFKETEPPPEPTKTPLDESMFWVDTSSVTYTGEPIEKAIASTLVEGVDYEVTYADNVDAGTATITITGTGDYEGTLTYEFTIERAFVRLAGDDRYGTMEEIDDTAFESANTVVLAAGSNFPDALAAAGLAGTLDAPIVLTATDALSAEAAEEITRLGASNVVIVGGENSVSAAVAQTLEAMGVTVMRVFGADRYETAVEAYYAGLGSWGTSGNGTAKTAIIAAGASFPDTLSASSYAWWATSPIFLSSSTGLDEATQTAITSGGFERIVIVGGVNSVPASVETWATDIAATQRLSGDNRYDTSVTFATWAAGEGMSFNNAGIATGKNFPDALAGGALCGQRGSVVLLADYDGGTQAVDLLSTHKNEISRIYYLGGVNSVTPDLTALIEGALS